MPAIPPQPGSHPPATAARPGSPAPGRPPRRTAFAEGVERLRAAAVTEPGRLRTIGAVLALLVVAFGAVTAWQTSQRAAAADDVLHKSRPLSAAAADVYRALADANTAASSGFLAGGQETKASRDRYELDIRTAAAGLVTAAGSSDPGSPAAATITRLNRLLPEYKGLVERARTYNRQGFPVGGAYLRYANEKMQQQMLPAAEDLYTKENERLAADYADATPTRGRRSRSALWRWPRWAGPSTGTTGAPTASSTTAWSRPPRRPRWCCCGWSSATASPARTSTTRARTGCAR